MSNEEIKLPPLPASRHTLYSEGDEYTSGFNTGMDGYDDEALNDYARAAILADRAARPVADAGETVKPVAWMDPDEGCVMDAFIWSHDAASPRYRVPVYDRAAPSARTLSEDIPAEFLFAFEKYCCKNPARIKLAWSEAVALLAATATPAEALARLAARPTTATPERLAEFADPTLPEVSGNMGTPAEAPSVHQDVCAEMRALCSACGGTGDISTITGDHAGKCDCPASAWSREAPSAQSSLSAASKQAQSSDAPSVDVLYAAWHKVGADVAGLKFEDFVRALQGKPEAPKGGN